MDDLMAKLMNAKKIMNKLDTNDYTTGNINQNVISRSPEEVNEQVQSGNIDYKTRVNESRLPDAIKQVMVENPIEQPDMLFSNSLDLKFDEISKQMEKQGLKRKPTSQQPMNEHQQVGNGGSLNEMVLRELKPLLEHIVETTIERVLNERLSKQEEKTQKINENLHIKVGDSTFSGKITAIRSNPTKKK